MAFRNEWYFHFILSLLSNIQQFFFHHFKTRQFAWAPALTCFPLKSDSPLKLAKADW